jgi:LEA14-like dessication related protein
MRRRWIAAVAAGVLLSLSGCPGVLKPLEKPTADFQGLSLLGVGFSGLDARAAFILTNPNSIGLPLRAVDWELSIGGASPLRGRVDVSATIPAKGSAPIDVDLHVTPAAAVETAGRISAGATDYRVSGTMHFQTSLGDVAVAFDHSGALQR